MKKITIIKDKRYKPNCYTITCGNKRMFGSKERLLKELLEEYLEYLE